MTIQVPPFGRIKIPGNPSYVDDPYWFKKHLVSPSYRLLIQNFDYIGNLLLSLGRL